MDKKDEFRQRFENIKRLRLVEYGVLFEALDTKDGNTVALQTCGEKRAPGISGYALREISIMKGMQHANIIRLKDVVDDIHGVVVMVFEYMHERTLSMHMLSPEFSMNSVKMLLYQILRGISYCHSRGILHRNLNPDNLLIDAHSNKLIIAEFALAREYIPLTKFTVKMGTVQYNSPEHLLELGNYSTPLDIWSVGCIFAEMVNKRILFRGSGTKLDQLHTIFSIMGFPSEETWPELRFYPQFTALPVGKGLETEVPDLEAAGIDLLSKMLCLDPSERITASSALEHEYFNDVGDVP